MSSGYGSSWDAKQDRIREVPLDKSTMICQCGHAFKLTLQGVKYCDWCFISRDSEESLSIHSKPYRRDCWSSFGSYVQRILAIFIPVRFRREQCRSMK